MTDQMPEESKSSRSPLSFVALVLAATAATLLLGGVLFAFANADAQQLSDTDRYRLLGQAANPFIAFLSLAAVALAVRAKESGNVVAAPKTAVSLGAVVSAAVILLAVNGILTDITGGAAALFRMSAVVSRLGTIALSAFALWIAAASKPS